MYKDKLDGMLSAEDYLLFRQSLSQEEQRLSGLIADTSRQAESCRSQAFSGRQSAAIEQYLRFDRLDRTAADEFIDCVEIGMTNENGLREVHIRWKL